MSVSLYANGPSLPMYALKAYACLIVCVRYPSRFPSVPRYSTVRFIIRYNAARPEAERAFNY